MEYLELFIRRLASKKESASKNTIKNYLADIRHFINWYEKSMKSLFEAKNITSDVISLYEKAMGGIIENSNVVIETKLGASSMKRHISSLRKFFAVLTEEGAIENNPFDKIEPVQSTQPTDYWHLRSFKDQLIFEKASKVTIKSYVSDILGFAKWYEQAVLPAIDSPLTSAGGFYLITQNILDDYKSRLIEVQNAAPRTINRKLSALRKYLDFASKQGFIDIDELTLDPYRISEIRTEELLQPKIKLSEVKAEDEVKLTYSPFPPIRLIQRLLIFPYIAFEDKAASIIASIIAGKPAEGLQKLPSRLSSQLDKKNALRSRKLNLSTILGVTGVQKDFYQPNRVSLLGQPLYKKVIHHVRYTRPSWYHKYHNYAFVHYVHFALLIIFAAGVGVALYNNLVAQKQQQASAAPATPSRVLSFQGRLTDNLDNPITSPTSLRFMIYNSSSASGSAELWEESRTVVPDQDGIFSVNLGADSSGNEAAVCGAGTYGTFPPASPYNTACLIPPSVFSDNSAIWLGVTVQTTTELTPRQRIATVAFASNSQFLQGLPPITSLANGDAKINTVLALDSAGNLTIGGSTNPAPVFQATDGQFTLSGKVLYLRTVTGTDTNIVLSPDGLGKIDVQKGLINSTTMGNLASGAVEVNDKFAVLATESAVAAFVVNNNTTGGDIFTASSSGTTRLTIQNDGTLVSGKYTGNSGAILYTNGTGGIIAQSNAGINGQCLNFTGGAPSWGSCGGTSYWTLSQGAIYPIFDTADVLIGGTSTSSAKFRFLNNISGTPIASISANSGNNALFVSGDGTLGTTNRQNLTLGNSSTYNTTGNTLINPNGTGRLGIFTANPLATFDLRGTSGTQTAASISANTTAPTLLLDNSGVGDLIAASASGVSNFIVKNNGDIVVGQGGTGKITAAVVDPYLVQNQKTTGTQSLTFQTMGATNADFIFKNQSTTLSTLTMAGQLQLPITGSNGGIVLGGDTQIYRGNTDRIDLATGDSFNIVNGNLQIAGNTVIDNSANATFNSIVVTGGCTGCGASGPNSPFQTLQGTIAPINSTLDFLIGGQATTSAKFAVLNVNNGTPTASVSSGLNGTGAYIDANGNFATTKKQTLTLGSSETGNIAIGTDATARAISIGNTTGATSLSLDSGTGAINIGTSIAKTITIGNTTGASAVNINAGTGSIALASTSTGDITLNSADQLLLDSAGVLELNSSAGIISIGNDAVNQNINIGTGGSRSIAIGNSTANTAVSLTSGGSGQIIINSASNLLLDSTNLLELNSSGGVISIGNDAVAQAINIGNGSAARTITIGNITGASAIELAAGTGGINIGDGTPTKTIDIGGNDSNAADTVRIATNGTSADTISIGNNNASTTLALTGGTAWSITSTGTINSSSVTGIALSGSDADIAFSGSANHDISASSGTLRLGAFTLLGDITGGNNSITGLNNLSAAGTITFSGFTGANNGGVIYANSSGVLSQTGAGTSSQCLLGGATPSFGSCTSLSNSPFEVLTGATAITQKNTTLDFLLGAIATSSAKFAVINIAGGTPTASISAQNANGQALSLGADGTIQTTRRNQLTIGGSTTGNITVQGNGTLSLADATVNLTGTNPTVGATGSNTVTINGNSTGNIQFFSSSNTLTNGGALTIAGNATINGTTIQLGNGSAGTIQTTSNQNLTLSAGSGTLNLNTVSNGAVTTGTGLTTLGGNLTVAGATTTFNNASPSITTNTNTNLTITPNGNGSLIVNSDLDSGLLIGTSGNVLAPLSVSGGIGSRALAILNQINSGDILTASVSGATRFRLANDGSLVLRGGQTSDIDTLTATTLNIGASTANTINIGNTTSGTAVNLVAGTGGINLGDGTATKTIDLGGNDSSAADTIRIATNGTAADTISIGNNNASTTVAITGGTSWGITTGGALTVTSCTGCGGVSLANSPFEVISNSGVITEKVANLDFLIGGTSTPSAKFAVLNINNGTPTASVSATGATDRPGLYIDGTGTLSSVNKGTLTIGTASTGSIAIGTDATARTISIGNTTGASTLNLDSGTGNINIGNTIAKTISIGNSTGATALTLTSGTGSIALASTSTGDITANSSDTLLLDSAGVLELNSSAGVISIGNDAVNQNINLGTAGTRTIAIGNTTSSTTLNFDSGTGGINIGDNTITKTLDLGGNDSSAADTIRIATNGTAADTISIGNSNASTTVTITGGTSWGITSGGALTVASCTGCGGVTSINSPFEVLPGNNAISEKNTTLDFLLGGTSTASAKFAVLNVAGGTPTASISAQNANGQALVLGGDGTIQTVRKNSLTIGGSTTGNITIQGNGTLSLVDATVNLSGTNPTVGATGSNTVTINGNSTGNIQFFSSSNTMTNAGALTIAGNATINGTTLQIGNGSNSTIQTAINGNLTLTSAGSGNTTLSSDFNSSVFVGNATTPAPLSVSGGIGSNAGFIVNRIGSTDDIFTASSSGTTKLVLTNGGSLNLVGGQTSDIDTLTGTTLKIGATTATTISIGRSGQGITLPGFTGQNGILYGTSGTGVLAQTTTASSGLCLLSGGSNPTWGSCGSVSPTNSPFQVVQGSIVENNTTQDLLIGSTSTASAKFAVLNVNGSGPVTASVSGNLIVMPTNGAGGFVGLGVTNPGTKLAFASNTTAAGGISFGNDANLYRSATSTLASTNNLLVGSATTAIGTQAIVATTSAIETSNTTHQYGSQYFATQLGSDRFLRTAYIDDSIDAYLKYVRCTNFDCTSKNETLVDDTSHFHVPMMQLGTDGYGRIVYLDTNFNTLEYRRCTNADCSTSTKTTINYSGTYLDVPFKIASDGFARIIDTDSITGDMNYIQCTNADCTATASAKLDAAGNNYLAIPFVLGSDQFARVFYEDQSSGDLRFVRCANASCSTKNVTTISTANYDVVQNMEIAPDGFARLVYYDGNTNALYFAQCTNADCSTRNTTTLTTYGYGSNLKFGSDGFARMTIRDAAAGWYLTYIQCTNASCSTSNSSHIGTINSFSDTFTLDSNNYASIVYQDGLSNRLFVIHCTNASCSTTNGHKYIADDAYVYNTNASPIESDGTFRFVYLDQNTSLLNVGIYSELTYSPDGNELYIAGDVGVNSSLYADGSLYLGGEAQIAGNTSIGGNLSLTGTANFDSTLNVWGTATFNGTVSFNGSVSSSSISTNSLTASSITLNGELNQSATTGSNNYSSYDTTGTANDVYVSGKYAYVADGSSGLEVFNISTDTIIPTPSLLGTYDTSGTANGVVVNGKYAYVADGTSGLQIIDVSNPSSPSLVGTYDTTGTARKVYLSGKYAYVADDTSGLQIIDVSNPASPTLVGTYNTAGTAYNVYVTGNYAYVADGTSGLAVINVSTPHNPTLTGSYSTSIDARGVDVSGNYAYIADPSNGLRIIDISNPASPSLAASYNVGSPVDVQVAGRYAYITNSGYGLYVINIASPAFPSGIGSVYAAGISSNAIFVSGRYVYYAAGLSGVYTTQITGITSPAIYAGNVATNDLTVTENTSIGNNLYVGNGLNIGAGGILTQGSLSVNSGLTSNLIQGAPIGKALLILNQQGSQDIFTASSSGVTKFSITNAGGLKLGTSEGISGQCIQSNGVGAAVSWGTCGSGGSSQFTTNLGSIIEGNTTMDFLLGGTSTTSAKFSVLNVAGSLTPVASISAQNAAGQALVLGGDGTIQTTRNNTLTLGGATNGDIIFKPGNLSSTFGIFSNGKVALGTATPISAFHVTRPLSFGATGKALAIFDQIENQDIFTASSSGLTKFVLTNSGSIGLGLADAPAGKSRTPEAKLDIYSSLGTSPAASISANTSAASLIVNNDSLTGDIFVASKSGGPVFIIDSIGDQWVWGTQHGPRSDFAEYYKKANTSEQFQAGQLICLATTGVTKCDASNPSLKLIGVISDNALIAGNSSHAKDPDYVLVGMVGQLGAWVTGDVKAGDPLTYSTTPGYAVKATSQGNIIGYAKEDNNGQQKRIDSVIQPDYFNPNDNLQKDNVFDNLSIGISNGVFAVIDSFGNSIKHIDAFSKLMAANIRAGFINAETIATGSLSIGTNNVTIAGQNIKNYVENIVANYIASNPQLLNPLASADQIKTNMISPLADSTAPSLKFSNSQISILNSQSDTVAWFDKNGNASFSGQLTANNIQTNNASVSGNLVANNATIQQLNNQGNATVSGTLYANNIQANSIQGLDEKIATLASVLNGNYQPQGSGSGQFSNLFAGIVNATTITADFGIFEQGITSMGAITATNVTAMDSIAVGTNFTISDNAINTLGAELALQSLRQADISFEGGLIRMDTDGNMSIAGNLNLLGEIDAAHGVFAGTLTTPALATSIISPLAGDDLTIKLTDKQASAGAKLRVVNNQNKEVLSVDNKGNLLSSGSATFAKLNFNLVGQAEATSLTEAVATGSAGFATLRAHQPEITIKNPNITSKSLIYITPFGDTNNKVLYLLRQVPQDSDTNGSFTVGLSGSTSAQDIQFNWLIVN